MTEEQFTEQEAKREKVERRKEAVKAGTPMPDSVEEFLMLFQAKLHENPLLEEYIRREHAENKETIALMRDAYEQRIQDQDTAIAGLESEVNELRRDLAEVKDNFNLFAGKLVVQGERRLALVQRAVLTIEKELAHP